MAWSRFVPGFTKHVKRTRSSVAACWLWTCGVDHATMLCTDGVLDVSALRTLCPQLSRGQLKRAVDELIANGSWEQIPGGFKIHGYLEHNLSAADVAEDRALARARYQRWRAKANAEATRSQNVGERSANAAISQSVSQDIDLEPRSKRKETAGARARGARAARRASPDQAAAPGIAHAIRTDQQEEAELQVIATAMGISVPEVKERQRLARARGNGHTPA